MAEQIIFSAIASGLFGIALGLHALNQTLKGIMATLQERLSAIEASLDEASTELTTELAKLREQLGNVITPEADAIITRLEAKSKALADIIPN